MTEYPTFPPSSATPRSARPDPGAAGRAPRRLVRHGQPVGGRSETSRSGAHASIAKLADEAGVPLETPATQAAPRQAARRRAARPSAAPTTKSMEQMLWDAACSIRGEKDAPKFKDYLLPLLFLKRLSDVFDDEIARLAEDYGDRDTALEIADVRSLPAALLPAARGTLGGHQRARQLSTGRRTSKAARPRPRDIGEHLTKAVRAVVKHNPTLSGVIDIVDFAAERNGERDINPAKLRGVVETFSDPRYRLGLADVQPDFLGRAYEYLLRKFAEGSGPERGRVLHADRGRLPDGRTSCAHARARTCHDYACGSAGLLIKLQLVAQRARSAPAEVPLKLYGPGAPGRELRGRADERASSMTWTCELQRGDTMINPKFRDGNGTSGLRHRRRQSDVEPALRARPLRERPVRPLRDRRRHHHRQGRLGVVAAHAGLPQRQRPRRCGARHRRRHPRLWHARTRTRNATSASGSSTRI